MEFLKIDQQNVGKVVYLAIFFIWTKLLKIYFFSGLLDNFINKHMFIDLYFRYKVIE